MSESHTGNVGAASYTQTTPAALSLPLPMSQAALEAMPFPFSIYTCDGLYVAANEMVEQFTRVPKSAIIGKFNYLTDPVTQASGSRPIFLAAVAGERGQVAPIFYDFSFPGTDTSDRAGSWVEGSFLPFRDESGRVTHVGILFQDVTERVLAEHETNMLKALVENASDGISVANMNGQITYCNPAYQRLTGYGADVIGMPITAIHPDDADAIKADFAHIFETGHWRSEMTTRRADGSILPTEISAFVLRDHTGQLTGTGAILRDLTAQYAQEQRLRMFETLVENVTIGLAFTDLQGIFTYANRNLCDTYGYGETIIGMDIPQILLPEERGLVEPNMGILFSTGRMTVETIFICHDGSTKPTMVDALLILGADGKPQALAAIVRDLTEERAREQELRLSKLSLDRSPDNIHWIDSQSKIVYVNDGACKLLDYTHDELIGMSVGDIDPVFPIQDWDSVWGRLKQQGVLIFESFHRRKDGSIFPVDVVSSFIEFEGREYASVVARDISERKQREEELSTFKAMVENTPDAIGIADSNGIYRYVNPAYQAMLRSKQNLVGMNGYDVILEEDRALVAKALANLSADRTCYVQARYRRADGNIFPAAATIFLQETTDGKQQIIGFLRDISEQKRAEEERAAFQQQIIDAQQAALRELSTPLIPIADGVVAMPLIGSIDSNRAQMVVETLLNGTAELQAHTTIIDITGVPIVDTQVANALLRAAQAVKLLGARVILTGIRPEVAQTLVGLSIDLSGIITRGTLQSGIAEALGQITVRPTNRR